MAMGYLSGVERTRVKEGGLDVSKVGSGWVCAGIQLGSVAAARGTEGDAWHAVLGGAHGSKGVGCMFLSNMRLALLLPGPGRPHNAPMQPTIAGTN